MVSNEVILKVKALPLSVKDIKKLTHSAEDVAEWAIINRLILALLVDIQQLDLEDVHKFLYIDKWSKKVQQRKGTGTGRMRYLKTIPRVFKNQIKGLAKWLFLLFKRHPFCFYTSQLHDSPSVWTVIDIYFLFRYFSNFRS